MLRLRESIVLVAFVLGACSASPAADPDGGTTTSPGSTSSATQGESGEDTGTSSEPELDLPAEPDLPEPATPCDVWLQDCAQSHKCVGYESSGGTWDAFKCVPILGDGELGEACTWAGNVEATDDCGAGSMCWGAVEVDGQLVGQCAALCQGEPDEWECGPEASCVGGDFDAPAVCATTCDVLLQDCPGGLSCTFDSWGGFICIVTDGVALGQPCDFFDDCEIGTMCVPSEVLPSCEGSSCCAAFCNLEDPVCTIPGTECMSFFEEGQGPPQFYFEGICIDPEA